MAHVTYAADELVEGDLIMWNTDILEIVRVVQGQVERGPNTGKRWVMAYFADGTAIDWNEWSAWHTTVLNAS